MSELFVFFTLSLVAVGIAAAFTVNYIGHWNKIFRAAALKHGLAFVKGGFLRNPSLNGLIDLFPVEVFLKSFSHGKSSTLTVGFKARFSPAAAALKITPEGFWKRTFNIGSSEDIQLRDESFDDLALVSGSDTHQVRALLHPEAKRIIATRITDAYAGKFKLKNGELETYVKSSAVKSADSLSAILAGIVRLGKLVSRDSGRQAMLRENFEAEKTNSGRMAYLESLAAVSGKLTANDEVIRQALGSGHPPLEFQAIRSIGPAGDVFLPRVFRAASPDLAFRILSFLEERKAVHLVPDFIGLGKAISDWKVRAALVRFLASTGHDAGEAYIRQELSIDIDTPVSYKKECIRALGRCGSRESIALLYRLQGVLVRHDVREAMAAIQSRLGLKVDGMLSFHEPGANGGTLSLEEEGESPAGENPGQG